MKIKKRRVNEEARSCAVGALQLEMLINNHAYINNWVTRSSAADNSWRSVCWSPELGIFVAVAGTGTGNRVMTSPDGINWTIRTSAADNEWLSVCWSPELGIFVAVAGTGAGNRVMTNLSTARINQFRPYYQKIIGIK